MADPQDIVDIRGMSPQQPANRSAAEAGQKRPWLAVHWKCCRAYSRIYRNRAGTAYEGRCPKCGSPVKATIGPGGTSNRFFEAK